MIADPVRALAAAELAEDWARAATISERHLGDLPRAIACWRRVLDRAPADAAAHDALERIFSYDQRWPELVAILEARLALLDDRTARRAILGKLVALHRDVLQDESRASDASRRLAALE